MIRKVVTIGLEIMLIVLSAFIPKAYAQAATASFSLSPSTGTYSAGDTISVDIVMNTGGSEITTTEASLVFDPDLLEVSSFDYGDIISTEAQDFLEGTEEIDNDNGNFYVLGLFLAGYSGTGTLATVDFKVLAYSGTASIDFEAVGGNDNSAFNEDGTNVLGTKANGSYTLSTTSGGTNLPESGIANNLIIVLGVIFLLGGTLLGTSIANKQKTLAS